MSDYPRESIESDREAFPLFADDLAVTDDHTLTHAQYPGSLLVEAVEATFKNARDPGVIDAAWAAFKDAHGDSMPKSELRRMDELRVSCLHSFGRSAAVEVEDSRQIQEQQIERVSSNLSEPIREFAKGKGANEWSMNELTMFVMEKHRCAPDSPGRTLRMMKQSGELDYENTGRAKSKYRFTRVPV